MSTAAKTPNYNLSQVAGPDTPDWITDYTSDMSKIDDALKENADDIATVRPDEFSEESTYAAGDYCIKDNVIYKAKTAVEAGAFDISDWTATTIFDELSGLNQNMTAHKTSGDHDSRYYTKTQVNDMVFEDLGLFSNADNLDKTKFYKGVFQSGSTQYAFIQIPSVFSIQMIFLNTADADVDRVGFRLATESSFSGVSWSWLRNGAR